MSKSAIATKIWLALGLVLAMIFGSAPVGAFAAVIRTTYIVQVQEGHAAEVRASIGRLGETPHDELTEVMDGFVVDLTDTEVAALRAEPNVIRVEQDQPMQLLDTQSPVPSWGLDRIDQPTTTLDNSYSYPANAGAGVRIYVVDTGVQTDNPDFAGRFIPGIDLLGQGMEASDCHGHGTHVAGTAAGTKYGVAKKALIVPIRVLGCGGSGTMSTLVSAMDWIITNNPAGTPAVMSMSIGGGFSPVVNTAVERLATAGITPVIAAGNSNADACNYSPAAAPSAITVGASDANDARASWSNFGDCVDVFGPGVNIVSDSNVDPTGSRVMSGTSMATPHVSGLAALYLGSNPTATVDLVTTEIRNGGLNGAITNALSANGNILINNKFIKANVPVAPPAPVNPPTAVVSTAITSTSATISWTAPATVVGVASTAPESYLVEYKLATDTTWLSTSTTTTSTVLTGLTSLSNYVVRVTSVAGAQTSAPTAELQFSTLGTAPDAPTALVSTAIYGDQIDLAWTAPNSNGAAITGYYLEKSTAGGAWSRIATPYGKSWSVTKLTPLTNYSFRIQAFNIYGAGAYSIALDVATSSATPAVPNTIVLSNITGEGVTATWKASPALDAATPITYVVSIYSRAITNYGAVLKTFTTTSTTLVVTGLKHTTAYSLGAIAYSGTIASPPSSKFLFTTGAVLPTAPTVPGVTKTSAGYDITWMGAADDGGSPITSYLVDRQNADGTWTNLATVPATTFSYSVVAPARGTTQNYRVSAVNAIGTGPALAIGVSTPVTVPTAPTGLALTRGTASSTLTWTAPADDGGAAIKYYVVYRSADNGTTWTTLTSIVASTTFTVALPAKGVKYTYAVAATNSTGTGVKSNLVTDETLSTVASAVRSISFSYPVANKLQISWTTPADNGGTPITAYRLERQAADGTWSLLNESNVLSFQIGKDLPGVLVTVRVTAINSVGASVALISSWRTPFTKASAPQNFTAVDGGTSVVTRWSAPADLGGSAVTTYQVQVSRDNGVTWVSIASVGATVTGVNVARPTKGQTWSYRVVANTSFGQSDASSPVAISASLTAPAAPNLTVIGFAANGSMNVFWSLPADNGGSALTSVLVEKSLDNVTWTQVAALAGTALQANFPRELPGVRVYFRVKSVNAIGSSPASLTMSILTPYLKASAPQNFAAVDTGSAVALTWIAPANLGGSSVTQHAIWVSRDAGVTWSILAYAPAAATAATVMRPTKGQTWQYRITARTGFGDSDPSAAISITSATTVSSAPVVRSFVLNTDATATVTWAAPTDLGGVALTGYLIERSADNVNWTALPSVAANVLTLTMPSGGPGTRTYVRIKGINSVGTSVQSSVASVMVPYQLATAPTALQGAVTAGRVLLTWTAPTSTGGAPVTQYTIEFSADGGATWLIGAYSTTTSVTGTAGAKGVTLSYRVKARTAAGFSPYSNVASVTTPQTVTSAVRLMSAVTSGAGAFNLTFGAPTDLGGYTSYNYRVEVFANNAWTVVASGVGAATNVVALTTANRTTIYTYRVIATNASGDSPVASFNYRG